MLKEIIESVKEEFSEYIDSLGNIRHRDLYKDILRDIVNVDKNWAVMYGTKLHITPKAAANGDMEMGPNYAKKILPKIQKAVKKHGLDAKLFDVILGPKSKRKNSPKPGGIKIVKV